MTTIFGLQGFLGLENDWKGFSFPVSTCDLVKVCPPVSSSGMWNWAEQFNAQTRKKGGSKILMGYSLGGRLAMHALLQQPRLWDGAIIISAHPGYQSDSEKKERLQKDYDLADQFEKDPWDELMTNWNALSAFDNSKFVFSRYEKDYSRIHLANTLRYWSLGVQDDLRFKLSQLQIPILWVAGKNDFAYASLASSLSFAHQQSEVWIASDAGHRVPWESKYFEQKIKGFIHAHSNKIMAQN